MLTATCANSAPEYPETAAILLKYKSCVWSLQSHSVHDYNSSDWRELLEEDSKTSLQFEDYLGSPNDITRITREDQEIVFTVECESGVSMSWSAPVEKCREAIESVAEFIDAVR